MTRISFHQKLDNLRERLLQMAGVAEQTLTFALDAHCRGELSACAKVRLNEVIITVYRPPVSCQKTDGLLAWRL